MQGFSEYPLKSNIMNNKFWLTQISFLIITGMTLNAQLETGYQLPPEEILELADAKLPPSVRISSNGDQIILLYRNRYKTIEEMSEKEMKLAGLRINPALNISSRQAYYYDLKLMNPKSGTISEVDGIPPNARISNLSWSPDEKFAVFTNSTNERLEIWLIDIPKGTAKVLIDQNINANLGRPFTWFPNSSGLLVKMIPESKKELIDKKSTLPTGPVVSINSGQKAQNRTYQDLLKDGNDEFNFEQLTTSEIYHLSLDGKSAKWMEKGMYTGIGFSPDGKYVLINSIQKPFSYIVPFYRFPTVSQIMDKSGKQVAVIEEKPLIEVLPKGYMAVHAYRRNIQWRNDKPSTIIFATAMDGGDPSVETPHRDQVFQLEAPFNTDPEIICKTIQRVRGIQWGNDHLAIVTDLWWNTRNVKTYLIDPGNPDKDPIILFDRNYQDRYNDPGSFITHKNSMGRYVLEIDGPNLYLEGDGYSAEGIKPFIDKINIKTQKIKRLWQADSDNILERIINPIDIKKGLILTRLESKEEFPNYYLRNIKKKIAPIPITAFKNPFEAMDGVFKEVIKYKREDSVDLSATLYLPAGYDKDIKEKLPMILWAYPFEFKDKSSAGQVTSSPNEFIYPWYGSPVFWLQRGYAVLDDASFPIIGEGETEPNDSFIPQLVANAKAAIDAVDTLGYIDRNKVAVGGHSYGAFMTANLLSHSNLFAAGIARSGAYNRSLTPFGFQSEERNYWEAPEIYNTMSPFMHADKMNAPLLLIHGQEDNNSGTYPMQSERYFNALKGLGATVRLVMLPKESHGYRARESVLHLLWEQDQWLEKYVKNRETAN